MLCSTARRWLSCLHHLRHRPLVPASRGYAVSSGCAAPLHFHQPRRRQASAQRSEQAEYEEELHRLYEERRSAEAGHAHTRADADTSTPHPSTAPIGEAMDGGVEEDDEWQDGRWGDVGVFVPHSMDVDCDPSVSALRSPSSSLPPSLRSFHLHRMVRWKAMVRDAVVEELGQQTQLREVPIHCHGSRLSSQLRDVVVLWHLAPISPSSSLVRLPTALRGLSVPSVVSAVQRLLDGCATRIGHRLAREEQLSRGGARRGRAAAVAVPHLRFVFDDAERLRRRKEMERKRGVEDALSAGERKAKEDGQDSEEQLQAVDAEHFQHFNPFWQPTAADRAGRATLHATGGEGRMGGGRRRGGKGGRSSAVVGGGGRQQARRRWSGGGKVAGLRSAQPVSAAPQPQRQSPAHSTRSQSRVQQLAAVIAQQKRMRDG